MTWMVSAVRRSLWLVLIGAVGGVAWSWYRDRTAPPTPPAPPEWPPLTATPKPASATGSASGAPDDSDPGDARADTAPTPARAPEQRTAAVPSDDGSAASFVNALVDTPDARSDQTAGTWVEPDADGQCPDSHPIKANDNSGIFHVPGGRFYARTKAERCYATAADAIADGYRQAKA